jgi:hypothetical protein
MNLVTDNELTTTDQARPVIEQQAQELARMRHCTVDEAREEVRRDLELAALLCSPTQRSRFREIFDLKEPNE